MEIAELAAKLQVTKNLVVSTGAGVSKESGIPTFRDAQKGLWAQFDPQDLATPEGFIRNPKMVWEWYEFRRKLINKVEPNPGHYALAELETMVPKFTLITQNIDNLHRRAGSKNILELHGNILRYKCFEEETPIVELPDSSEAPPRCSCGAFIRPDVVWYGELPLEMQRAFEVSENCDMMIVVGTSGMVQPAASLPVMAKQSGAFVLEINPEESAITPIADVFLKGPSGEILPKLVTKFRETANSD